MGIDLETWRARIGLFHAASVGRYLRRQQRTAQRRVKCWSDRETKTMNCVPRLLVSLFVAVLVKYVFQSSKYKGFRKTVLRSFSNGMKLCREVVSAAVHRQRSTVVALSLLLIVAGDVELNPGPVEELNLWTLRNVLSSVENKWYDIGLQLKIQPSKLKTFEADHRNCGRLLSETFEFWLGGNASTPVSWQSVINALNSPSVNERGLASQIQATYCQSTHSESSQGKRSTDEATPPKHPPCEEEADQSLKLKALNEGMQHLVLQEKASYPPSTTAQAKTFGNEATPPSPDPNKDNGSGPDGTNDGDHSPKHPGQKMEDVATKEIPENSFPLLDKVTDMSEEDKALLKARLNIESREIMKLFFRLCNKFRQSLCQRNFPLDELIYYLKVLEAYDPVKEVPPEQQESVLEEHMQQLKNATSINAVFDVVEKYCSFFNYDIIKCMIEDHGTDSDRLELQRYTEEFNKYAKRRIYECPSNLIKGKEEGAKLRLKMDSKYSRYSLEALHVFQVSLCKILKVSVHVLVLRQIDAGCIELSFQIPTFIQHGAFPLKSEQEAALSDLGVLSLSTGDYHFSIAEHQVDVREDKQTVIEGKEGPGGDDDQLFGGGFRVPHHHPRDVDADSAFGGTATSVFSTGETGCSEFTEDYFLDRDLEDPNQQLATSEQGGSKGRELCIAAKNGDLERVKTLVETAEHCNPLDGDKNGNNALHYAATGGSLKVLKYFVEAGYNPSCLSQHGRTPLHMASRYGHLDIVEYLVTNQQVDPLCQNERQWTPLHNACQGGNLSVVRFLVNKMSKYMTIKDIVNERTKDGSTPLHIASGNNHLNIVEYLVTDLQADPLCKTNEQWTPLHHACEGGNLSVVQFLVNEMSKCMTIKDILNERTKKGAPPLHLASKNGHLDIVRFFISELNCDPNIRETKYGWTPLHLAAATGQLHRDVVQYLVEERKCNPMSADRFQNTPLHYAALCGRLETVKYFIETLHCPPHIKGSRNQTPLQKARGQGHRHVVQYLKFLPS